MPARRRGSGGNSAPTAAAALYARHEEAPARAVSMKRRVYRAVDLLAGDFRPDLPEAGDTTGDAAEGGTTAALLPVLPAVLLGIVARCAFGAMTRALLVQLDSLIRRNQLPTPDLWQPTGLIRSPADYLAVFVRLGMGGRW